MTVRISCINKRDHHNPHERIINIGGVNPDGMHWKRSQQRGIVDIETGTYSYYVSVDGRTVKVIVALHEGNKYLKTESDSTTSNSLLSLPECP